MRTLQPLDIDLSYLKQLIGAGLKGIDAARREGGTVVSGKKPGVWTPAVLGSTLGILTTRLAGTRKSPSRTALCGLMGGALGLGAGLAWASRGFIRNAGRTAARRVNAVRDERWLATNPIDYA